MSTENPYFHRGPVRKPEHFFGRAQEVTNAFSLLKNSQSVSIVGPRRIGKTSFLLHISHPAVMTRHGLPSNEYIFVFIDCEGFSGLSQPEFYRLILEETKDRLLDQNIEAEIAIPERLTYRQFNRALRGLNRQGLKLIYIFDEFELMSENHNLDADFFSGLRGLTARHNVCYFTASQDHLLELSYAEGVLGSPFFNIFAVQRLGVFSQAEALQFIHQPSQAAGLAFSEMTAAFILDLAGPHPLFLNIACFHTFARLQNRFPPLPEHKGEQARGSGITEDEYQQVRLKVIAELEGHLRYYWGKLNDSERETLAQLVQTGHRDTTQVLFRRLEQYGLVIQAGGGYRYLSAALADFVERQVADERTWKARAQRGTTLVGHKLGRYVITGRIGQGGMAQVYQGRHEDLKRDVAVKILSAHLSDNEAFLERFRREAQAVAALRHPHIVQVHDFGTQGGLYYMVMEYVTGGTLQDKLDELKSGGGAMPLAEAVRIVHETAAALDYAHAQGVIHRDLKPANIMLTAAGQIIVADFGLARIAGSTRVTMTGAILGTPAYMSPEQILGGQVDARSDIYSLGVVLYEMVTGRLLFEGATPMEIIMKHLRELTSHQPNLGASLPGAIEPVILKALAKEPDDRHQSAGELAESLARAYAGDLSAHGSADNC